MNKVSSVTSLLGLAAILVLSFNAFGAATVFGQTPDDPNAGPIPEGNYTDSNTGPIPENDTSTSPDNSTSTTSGDTGAAPADTSMPSSNPLANDTMTPENTTGQQEASQSTVQTSTHSNLPPLEQVKAGTSPKDVQCKQGFTLIIKADDGSPACVDPQVAQILIQRGW